MPYADSIYYKSQYEGTEIDDDVEKYLKSASRDIDTLTFNRIVEIGIENLTEFQQTTIRDVTCQLADFKFVNKDLLESILNSYSINGVAMNFDKSWNIKIIKGVAIPKSLYSLLEQTGLTCRSFRW